MNQEANQGSLSLTDRSSTVSKMRQLLAPCSIGLRRHQWITTLSIFRTSGDLNLLVPEHRHRGLAGDRPGPTVDRRAGRIAGLAAAGGGGADQDSRRGDTRGAADGLRRLRQLRGAPLTRATESRLSRPSPLLTPPTPACCRAGAPPPHGSPPVQCVGSYKTIAITTPIPAQTT